MEENLRQYVEGLFSKAPKTQKMLELREEIFLNLKEKYSDLRTAGASEEEAYEIVKNGVGDVEELINSALDNGGRKPTEQERKRGAGLVAVAVMLYIISPLFIIVFGSMNNPIIGLAVMFILIAVATGLLVYRSSLRVGYDHYEKMDDSMVEEFKQWQVENKQKNEKKNAYLGAVWPIITAIYFVISFTTGAWWITWIIFIIGAAVHQIVRAALK